MKNWKKRIIAVVMIAVWVLMASLTFTGCGNQALFDTTYSFERAIIFLPDGTSIEGEVELWTDYEGSDMIQVTIDGKTYLTHSSNVIMISE